ncbi:hypothetical protein CcaverHIS631_0401200 [Cutaneotrichosporon cavernicola]|nr:hypothetical protein CcaverHIS631_0401200 [Cutaneotrichosporon cavernicola]BEJ06851.1 hypothetical protein CcaverHIS641_0401200 [Cutaneotrichosporon cavernicola]
MSPPSPPASPPPTTPSLPSFPHDISNSVASSSTHNLPFGSVRLNPAAFSASRDSVAAAQGKMLGDTRRHHWRRAGSIRSKSQPSLQDKAKLHTEVAGTDGYVPYRPPDVASSLSLSAPVKPSGAQGIGLAPAPAAPPERPQKKTIFGWFGRRKAKQKLASVSTPTLIETPLMGKQGQEVYPRFGHRPTAAQSADLLGSSPGVGATGSGVTDSPSVVTGLVAPKMLFSPLSRSMRIEGMDDHPYGSTYPSTPHIQHLPLQLERTPYPRVGDNTSTPALHGQRGSVSRWPEDSTVTLHSEGSRSRLTVNTVCDALTFPRPRMHAHEVTPPDTPELDNVVTVDPDDPNSSFDRVYAAGEVREAERTEWAAITRKSRSGSMRSLMSRRRSDEWSLREQPGTPVHPSWSRHSLTAGEKPEYTRSKSTASSIRSLFRSGTGRFTRHTRSHDNLPQQAMSPHMQTPVKRSSRPNTAPSLAPLSPSPVQMQLAAFPSSVQQAPWYVSSRPSHAPSSRRSTNVSEAPSTAITGAPTTPKTPIRSLPPAALSLKQRLPKSTSTPSLLLDPEHRVSFAPQRSRSARSQNIHSRSNPDLLNYRPAHSTTGHSDHGERLERLPERGGTVREGDRGRHGSPPPKLRRRQTGPPRTFQFRLQPPTHRHAPSGTNLVMVGGATAPDHSRLDSSRLHVKHPPRGIDFAAGSDPNRLPTPPPHLPTPDRSSPLNYDFPESEIGMAITTDQIVAPVQHRLPMDTPPSSGPPTREDPSSAHARYVLARQHRRQQTMRAFQSPPMFGDGRKSPEIYPQHRFSQMSMYSQVTTQSSTYSGAHSGTTHSGGVSAPMSPARFPRPGHPSESPEFQTAAQSAQNVFPGPTSPKSPKTSWFGRPRGGSHRSTSPPSSPSAGRRAMSPRDNEIPIRPRTPPSSWHRRRTSSRDVPTVPAVPPLPAGMRSSPRQHHIPLSLVRGDESPMLKQSIAPPTPTSSAAPVQLPDPPTPPYVPPLPLITASAAVPARPSSMSGRIPPLRRPPSRPPPPTPTPPVGSRTNSTDELASFIPSRSQSLRSFRSWTELAAMTSGPPAVLAAGSMPTRAPTPPNNDTFGEESTPRAHTTAVGPAPKNYVVATPPPQTGLPTIMDASPTPLRQTRVSVLAGQPPPDTPVGSLRANLARRSLSSNSGRRRRTSGPPLSAGLVSTSSGSPAANLFGARMTSSPPPGLSAVTPASPTPDPHEPNTFSPRMMSCWPTTTHGTTPVEVGTTPAQVDTSVSEGSRNQSSSDVQSWDSGETPMPVSSTSTLGAGMRQRQLTDVSTVASATSSVSLYSETDDNWMTPAASHVDTVDTDSEGGLSEATLPELLPISSSSALSNYEDAREGSGDWTAHEEPEEDYTRLSEARSATPGTSRHAVGLGQDESKSAVTPPATSATFTALLSSQDPRTPTRQARLALDDEDQNREPISPDTDTVESLMITPRAKVRSPRAPGTDATEPFEYDEDQRSAESSLSSGSDEGSMRNSMDENFRGLFFRTPQITAGPSTTRRPRTAPTGAPGMINPPARSDSRRPGTAPRAPAPPFGDHSTAESTPMVTAESTPVEEKQFSFVAGAAATPRPPQPLTSVHDNPKPLASIHDQAPKPLTSIHSKRGYSSGVSDPSRGTVGSPIGLEQVSPYPDAYTAKRALSPQTMGMEAQPISFQAFDSSSGQPINAPPSHPLGSASHARGLGVVMSPRSPSGDANLPGWDSVSRIGSSTRPIATLPRDDSWISASFRQAAAKAESATPGVMRDQSKHRVTSQTPSLSPSPSTVGVASSTFGVTPIVPDQQHLFITPPEQPPQAKRPRFPKGSVSSTSSFNVNTPHPDIVDHFPSPPRSRPRTG